MPTYSAPGVYVTDQLDALTTNNVGIPGSALPTFAGVFPQGPTNPTIITSWGQFQLLFGGLSVDPGNYFPYAVYQFFNNGGAACAALRVPNSDATVAELVLQDVNTPPDNIVTITANSAGEWGNDVNVEVVSAGTSGRVTVNVYNGGTSSANLVEQFVDLSTNPADPRYIQSVLNSPISGSNYVTADETLPSGTYSAGITDLTLISPTPLAGGTDGSVEPDLTQTIPTALDTMQDQILNVNVPGVSDPTVINALLTWAAGRGDVMIIIDGPPPTPFETSADVVNTYSSMVTGANVFQASTYAVLYAPWLLVKDPASTINGATVWLPPGGAALGVWNSTDSQVGPWQTPAGVQYGVLNCIDLEVRFTSTDLDNLNALNINAIKSVPGVGFCLFGGRTLHQGQPDRYIAVRREVIQLTHDFTALTNFAVFQPNTPTLWAQITTNLTNYLTQQMQLGVFAGTTPDTAFTVTCDSSNNTYATAIAGIVNITVGVALTSPAEFIIISIQQFTSSSTVTTTTGT